MNWLSQVTAAAALVTAGMGQAIGIEPAHLLGGFFGGLALLSVQSTMSRSRAVIVVVVAALSAGALTGLASVYVQGWFSRAPAAVIEIAMAFVLGLSSQALLSGWLRELPELIRRIVERVTGGGNRG